MRVDIEQWGAVLVKISCTSQGVEFPTSVGYFHEITTKILVQLAKNFLVLYTVYINTVSLTL